MVHSFSLLSRKNYERQAYNQEKYENERISVNFVERSIGSAKQPHECDVCWDLVNNYSFENEEMVRGITALTVLQRKSTFYFSNLGIS